MKLGFLGTGKMATAIARGLLAKNVLETDDISGVDVSADARRHFADETGAVPADDAGNMLESIDTLVVAVKPQVITEALSPLAGECRGKLIISIAAGVTLAKIHSLVRHDRIVRVMPNTPAMLGRGAAAFCSGSEVTEPDKDNVRTILEAVGIALEVPEEKMDAVTALSGSGPAYFFEMIQALIDAGAALGLTEQEAYRLAAQTAAGAAEMVVRGTGTPGELRNAVTSPGGTTAAGLAVLKQANFRKLMLDTVTAACERSRELGQEE